MYEWLEISSWKQSKNGTSKVYQDSKGNVRIDSFNGDVRYSKNHYRVTLNTRNGGNLSRHGIWSRR